jgi:hypothetical protein
LSFAIPLSPELNKSPVASGANRAGEEKKVENNPLWRSVSFVKDLGPGGRHSSLLFAKRMKASEEDEKLRVGARFETPQEREE